MHILFGSSLLATEQSLYLTMIIFLLVGITLLIFRREFIIEIFDPTYLQSIGKSPVLYQNLFLVLVVACLIVSFQTNGTLLSMGQFILPGIIARLWSQQIIRIYYIAILLSAVGAFAGLFISFHFDWPLGPSTLLFWGCIYLFSLILNPYQGFLRTFFPPKHYQQ